MSADTLIGIAIMWVLIAAAASAVVVAIIRSMAPKDWEN